jgi:hypothetical protein
MITFYLDRSIPVFYICAYKTQPDYEIISSQRHYFFVRLVVISLELFLKFAKG